MARSVVLLQVLLISACIGLISCEGSIRNSRGRMLGVNPSKVNKMIECVIASRTEWVDFVREHLADTYTGHFNRDEPLTPFLISSAKKFKEEFPNQPVLMVDVGAASYQGLDVSDTIFLGKRLKAAGINDFMFHSFEPGVKPMERLKAEVEKEGLTPQVTFSSFALTDTHQEQQLSFNAMEHHGAENTYSLQATTVDTKDRHQVANVTGMSFMQYYSNNISPKNPGANILLMKVDVEGYEENVIKGMHFLLESKRIHIVVAEYAIFWNELFFEIARKGKAAPYKFSEVPTPTLRGFTRRMHALGYDVYLFAKQVLVPISGLWWDDFYELCLHAPVILKTGHCWHDVIAVQRGSETQAALLQQYSGDTFVPGTYRLSKLKLDYCYPQLGMVQSESF